MPNTSEGQETKSVSYPLYVWCKEPEPTLNIIFFIISLTGCKNSASLKAEVKFMQSFDSHSNNTDVTPG